VKHRPELDGLRGIAIILVLGAHTRMPGFADGGGGAGVTLFFVLSGYLITSLLLAERSKTGRVSLRAFYYRRALRLFPALAVVLIAVALIVATGLMPENVRQLGTDYRVVFLGVLTYVSNWVAVAGWSLGVLGHTWSLAVEEQFYIIWPALLLIGLRMGSARFAVVVLLIAIAVTPWRFVVASDSVGGADHLAAGTDCHADALLLGCVVALLGTRMSQAAGWVGIAGLCVVMWLTTAANTVVFLPVAVIVSTLSVAGCPVRLAWAPLAFLGRISYGLYLWHQIVNMWGMPWFVVVPLSFAIACVSFALIERPFLKLKDRLRMDRPVSTSASPGLLSA
jgi:peptidoglycan/LPS O-acetylase OafA/YrhL